MLPSEGNLSFLYRIIKTFEKSVKNKHKNIGEPLMKIRIFFLNMIICFLMVENVSAQAPTEIAGFAWGKISRITKIWFGWKQCFPFAMPSFSKRWRSIIYPVIRVV
jgi:hypothetical protein